LSSGVLCLNPVTFRHAQTSPGFTGQNPTMNYLKGFCEIMHTREVGFVIATTPPYDYDYAPTVLWHGGSMLLMPSVIDAKSLYDVDNPLIRAARECELTGSATVWTSDYPIASITSDEAAEFVITRLSRFRKEMVSIQGRSSFAIDRSVQSLLSYHPTCKIRHKPLAFAGSVQVANMIKRTLGKTRSDPTKAFRKHPVNLTESPYLSIVIVGRNDGFGGGFARACQDYVHSIGRAIKAVPLADIELVIVDFGGNETAKTLAAELEVPAALAGKVRFVKVPAGVAESVRKALGEADGFMEYSAKNAGIRRAKGRFVLVTSPFVILPKQFFEFVSGRQFSDGIVYRAPVRGERPSQVHSLSEIEEWIDDPWLLTEHLNLTGYCPRLGDRLLVIDSRHAFEGTDLSCGINEFLMMSKKLFVALGGLNEYPGSAGVHAAIAAKLMRLVPGVVVQFLPVPVVERYHQRARSGGVPGLDVGGIVQGFICRGESPLTGKYADFPQWGLSTMAFDEITK
jgi:hypothetical protein